MSINWSAATAQMIQIIYRPIQKFYLPTVEIAFALLLRNTAQKDLPGQVALLIQLGSSFLRYGLVIKDSTTVVEMVRGELLDRSYKNISRLEMLPIVMLGNRKTLISVADHKKRLGKHVLTAQTIRDLAAHAEYFNQRTAGVLPQDMAERDFVMASDVYSQQDREVWKSIGIHLRCWILALAQCLDEPDGEEDYSVFNQAYFSTPTASIADLNDQIPSDEAAAANLPCFPCSEQFWLSEIHQQEGADDDNGDEVNESADAE